MVIAQEVLGAIIIVGAAMGVVAPTVVVVVGMAIIDMEVVQTAPATRRIDWAMLRENILEKGVAEIPIGRNQMR